MFRAREGVKPRGCREDEESLGGMHFFCSRETVSLVAGQSLLVR